MLVNTCPDGKCLSWRTSGGCQPSGIQKIPSLTFQAACILKHGELPTLNPVPPQSSDWEHINTWYAALTLARQSMENTLQAGGCKLNSTFAVEYLLLHLPLYIYVNLYPHMYVQLKDGAVLGLMQGHSMYNTHGLHTLSKPLKFLSLSLELQTRRVS